ncbi:apolipoprotein L6 [Micropterus salmoides]|uniref:apolipoprotein L6 n=1 Tax=Micropterus salmoides TaxID=27706 RepID=UPI0018EA585F|nr:apolipoprotein L6 [Micropterus salmoides]
MNMFKSDEGSTAPPPVGVPPRPSNEAPSIVSKAPSSGSLEEGPNSTQKPWMLKGVLQKVNPFRFTSLVPKSDLQNDSAGPPETGKELKDTQNSGMIAGMMQKVNPFKSSQPKDTGPLHSDLSFSNGSLADSNNLPEKQEAMEVEMLEMAEVPVPSKGTVLDPLDDEEGLLAWWRTVEDWDEWTEANQNDEEVVEQVADRVFMAARLFVHFFNQRGVSLQQRILELLDLADTADIFHKKTVTTSVGGGVASVAGSITTITGLILAPFTAGTSLIVTAVGIGIATAGGVASASANITDTVHSKMDRKKVEKMIQDYQEEMKDIKECLEFLQEGMETLEEWNFEKYAESISKKHLNQNVKHVMKEGGRAGKALVINTESLISTIQVLNVAGGAAKAAQVMSVTTGLMSGLFLALDVFFLAKDSMELKKGAKTEFAAKIREVCKDLQNGLLELNRIKEQVQKTMDGIEVEVEEGELLKSDLKKLVELKK